jgi:succinate-acetate transporter protein
MKINILTILQLILLFALLTFGVYCINQNLGAVAFFTGIFCGKIGTHLHLKVKKQVYS